MINARMGDWAVLVIALLSSVVCVAQRSWADSPEPLNIAGARDLFSLGQHIEMLSDPAGKSAIADVDSGPLVENFAAIKTDSPYIEAGAGVVWLRFSLREKLPQGHNWLLVIDRPDLQTLDFFYKDRDGHWQQRSTGTKLSFSSRELDVPNYAFRLDMSLAHEQMFYLRLRADRDGIVPIHIWSEAVFYSSESTRQLGLGLFYGSIAVMLLFNVALFVGLRDASTFFGVLYMGSSLLGWAIDSGLAFEYLWPTRGGWNNSILFIVIIINELVFLKFVQAFLQVRIYAYKLYWSIIFLCGLIVIIALSALFFGLSVGFQLNGVAAVLLLVVWMWTGGLSWRKGYMPGRFFFLAGCSTIIGITLNILMRQGVLPVLFWTQYSGHLGWVVTGFLISIGLAMRINQLRKERLDQEVRAREQRLRVEALARENERRTDEFERARQLQQQFLPLQLPEISYLDVAAYQRSATEVGGDYYDFYPEQNGVLCGAIGDATGHGISAGIVVACAKTALLSVADVEIQERMGIVNSLLKKVNLGQRMFMALMMFRLERQEGAQTVTMWLSGAGIPPAYVLRTNGAVEEVLVAGSPLGMINEPHIETATRTLSPGDRLVLMSDGLPERPNAQAEQLGYDRLSHLLAPIAQLPASAAATLEQILAIGENWSQGHPQDDDETFVVIKVRELP